MTPQFDIHDCNPNDFNTIVEMQQEAFDALNDCTMLRRNTPEMLASCLIPPHYTLGAWYERRLVAFTILYVPRHTDEIIARHLKHFDTTSFRTANYKLCIVRPDFRGYGLQFQLGLQILNAARQRGFTLLCATVAPNNSYSHNNLTQLGFVCDGESQLYGFRRNVYYLPLSL